MDKPQRPCDEDADIRFLDEAELNALLAAVPDDDAGRGLRARRERGSARERGDVWHQTWHQTERD
jgi:hypothetical protein